MKIEIDDMVMNGLVLDFIAEITKSQMKEIISDVTEYELEEDAKYYKKLKKAARTIYNYYSVQGVEL